MEDLLNAARRFTAVYRNDDDQTYWSGLTGRRPVYAGQREWPDRRLRHTVAGQALSTAWSERRLAAKPNRRSSAHGGRAGSRTPAPAASFPAERRHALAKTPDTCRRDAPLAPTTPRSTESDLTRGTRQPTPVCEVPADARPAVKVESEQRERRGGWIQRAVQGPAGQAEAGGDGGSVLLPQGEDAPGGVGGLGATAVAPRRKKASRRCRSCHAPRDVRHRRSRGPARFVDGSPTAAEAARERRYGALPGTGD